MWACWTSAVIEKPYRGPLLGPELWKETSDRLTALPTEDPLGLCCIVSAQWGIVEERQ